MKKIIQTIFSIYGFATFILLLLLLLPAFFIASLFGKVKGGNMFYKICSFWSDIWLFLVGVRVKVQHEAILAEHRPCIFVANHSSYMDIPMLVNVLREPLRVLGKQEMAGIPVFGYVYRKAVVMVNRKDASQRAKSVAELKKTLGLGISIFIFPEGTFNLTDGPLKDFYDGAFRIALETQTPIQPIIFPDSVKRLGNHSVFSLRPGICRAVYLPMVELNGLNEPDIASLKQKVYLQMEEALLRYRSK
ncbi:lysophospholipid acyltransferase family protein [Flavihumibacter profundi]|jgi:1-acyl-sn-glycerol-3-phosphate acyltransferase|uniref:lysophospholipid acyltransferase family protein n=1 Tax=Flavihumibacter profundi TaxID=2716883 RepID=UPI001CC5C390|nr:lysophospholipid acyltransferase family protein [Flavihumibacter profundi]MBZ5856345.1 1-acyl-sn-glycerol-3-phosphate acyltransferase [Flavihumibacter profundi]